MNDGIDTPYGEPIYLRPGEPIFIRGMETGPLGDEKQAALEELITVSELDGVDWKEVRAAINKLAVVALKQNYGEKRAQEIADEIPVSFSKEIINILTVGSGTPNFTETGSTGGPLQDLRKNVLPGDFSGP